MKTMFLPICLCAMLVSCGDTSEIKRQKKYLDALLRGESVGFQELQRDSQSSHEDYHSKVPPYLTATRLGYSEEDLAKLKNIRIVLEETVITDAIEGAVPESE